MNRPLWQLSAIDLGAAYRADTCTPMDALESVLARCKVSNPELNAVIALDAAAHDAAMASQARFAAGCPLGPLDGIPLSIKDNLLMAGVSATWGCAALSGSVAAADELPVARLRAQGAVLFGKTNVPEFTLEGYTDNAVFGTTRNPWCTALTPGGSSGGAVAAVAAGIGPLALCTDGGGSIRRPASHTGLVGLKPSIGAIARADGLPSLLLDFEVVGPVGRSVADVAMMFDALAGAHPRDRRSRALPADLREARRVLHVSRFDGAPVDPQVAAATVAAANVLRELGCEVEEGDLPVDLSALNAVWAEVGQIGLAALFALQPDLLERAAPKYREMAIQGAALGAPRLWATLERIDALRRAVDEVFSRWDAVLTPTAAALPWPAAEAYPPVIDGRTVGPRGHAVFTGWVNAAGNPALSLPALPSVEGLPIGIQLVGPWGGDRMLLALAERYEQLSPWAGRFDELWSKA